MLQPQVKSGDGQFADVGIYLPLCFLTAERARRGTTDMLIFQRELLQQSEHGLKTLSLQNIRHQKSDIAELWACKSMD